MRATLLFPLGLLAALGGLPAWADPSGPGQAMPPGAQPVPASTPDWADRCTDFRSIGWGFKAPENFLALVDKFTDPDIYLEFARRVMEPKSYVRVAQTASDPDSALNFMEWSDPRIYARWAGAFMNPAFYAGFMATVLDPAKPMRWAALPADPRTVALMATAANPGVPMSWMAAPFQADNWTPVAKAMDPETVAAWVRVLEEPDGAAESSASLARSAPAGEGCAPDARC